MARTTPQEYCGTQLVNSSAKPSIRKLMAMKQWFGDSVSQKYQEIYLYLPEHQIDGSSPSNLKPKTIVL